MDKSDGFEKLLEIVGDRGRYQSFLLCLFYAPFCFLFAWVLLAPIFVTSVPDHWCRVPGRPENVSLELWKNLTIPWTEVEGSERHDECHQFVTPLPPAALELQQASSTQENITRCTHGWQFDDKWYDETLATRNEWVCENSKDVASFLAVGEAGAIIGVLIFNTLADIFGRKPLFLILSVAVATVTLLRVVLCNGWLCLLLEFLSSFTRIPLSKLSLIWVSEQVGISWRDLTLCVFFLMWTTAMSLLPLVAWLTRSWIWLTVITSAPFFLFVFAYRIFESPRWLTSVNKREQALEVLQKISKINGKSDQSLEETFGAYFPPQKDDESVWQKLLLFLSSSTMRRSSLALTISAISVFMIYNILNFNVHNLSGNEFVNFSLLGLVELPSVILGWAAGETIGRRLSQVIILLLVAVINVIPVLLSTADGIETTICAILSKVFINGSFFILYLQSLEVFPTSHRAFGVGLVYIGPNIFDISSPYIAHSSELWSKLPYVFMAGISILGCAAAVFVPETVGQPLPQTIADCEAQLGQQPFWSYNGRSPKDWRRALFKECGAKVKWCSKS